MDDLDRISALFFPKQVQDVQSDDSNSVPVSVRLNRCIDSLLSIQLLHKQIIHAYSSSTITSIYDITYYQTFLAGTSIIQILDIIRNSMEHAKLLLSNALKHIMIDGRVTVTFYLTLHLILVLQLISVITHPQSDLFSVFQWFDPSNYLPPQYSVLAGFVLILSFLLILTIRLAITQSHQQLVKPSILMNYMGNILLHLQIILKTIVFIPMARGALTIIKNPLNPAHLALSIISLILYLILLFPMFLYNTSNTFILTPQINRKLNYWNVVILILIFKVNIVFANILNSKLIPIACSIYFITYICLTIKQPVFSYSHQQLHKGLFSASAFICFCRVANTIIDNPKGEILIEIFGIFFFAAFVDWISNLRIKQIIDLQKPTIYQIKLLLFMVENIEDYLPKLQYFAIKHHQKCTNVNCLCVTLLNSFSQKTQNLKQQTIWYEFLVSFINFHYCLQQMSGLPQSQLKIHIKRYQYIIVDLAQIYLFKLKKIYLAYNILNEYKCLTTKKGLHSIVYNQKRAVINYFLQCSVYQKYKQQGEVNLYADKYMNFQVEYDRYQKYLLHSSNKTIQLWEEMLKIQPDEQKLLSILRVLQKCNKKIRSLYQSITTTFQKSSEILQNITNQYFNLILNIPEQSTLHVIQTNKYQLLSFKKSRPKIQPLSQNMNSFSYNSSTPLCFVSVDIEDFGMIKGSNSIFNQVMSIEYGKVVSIDQFIIPEMRDSHRQKMTEFIRGDHFSRQHKNAFTLNSQGNLILTKLLIQIVPSISDGIKYIAFFKKLLLEKRVICIKNKNQIKYQSKSFEQDIEIKFNSNSSSLLNYLSQSVQQEIINNKCYEITIEQQIYQINYLHSFNSDKGINYLFVQVVPIVIKQNKTSTLKYRRISSTNSGAPFNGQDSVISKMSNQHEPTIVDKIIISSEMNHQAALQKQRKLQQSIKQTFEIIINRQNKNIIKKINLVLIIAGLARIALLISIIAIKNNNKQAYFTAVEDNSNYNIFLQLIIHYAIDYKQLNLYTNLNKTTNAQQLYKQIQNYPPINQAMDNFLINYDIPTLSQNWNTFTLNSKANYSINTQNNFLAVSDHIISPITNLNSANSSNYKFPLSLQLIPTPLNTIQIYFYQFITNALYVHIPSFRNLKQNIMDPILSNSIDNFIVLIILNALTFTVTIIWIAWVSTSHSKLAQLKTFSLFFLQSLGNQILEDKKNKCQSFINKYTQLTAETKHLKATQPFALTALYDSNKISKIFEDHTERQMSNNFNPFASEMVQNQAIIETNSQQQKIVQSRNKTNNIPNPIFKRQSFILIVCKYIVPCLLLMIYCLVFTGLQVTQNKTLHRMIKAQQMIQYIEQDINLIRLYSMQYGIYNLQLERYYSIPQALNSLITEMFEIQQMLFSNNNNSPTLPLTETFINRVFYNDLCQLEQQGAFLPSNYSFNSKGNFTQCLSISNQVLTKGFISSLLFYLQSANTVFLTNSNSFNYNSSQKQDYLNNTFFTDTVKLTNYFNLILDTILYYFNIDYIDFISQMNRIYIIASIIMIVWLVLIIITFKLYYLKVLNTEIEDIHSAFLLISYQSVSKNQHLKEMFMEKMEYFKLMK